MKLKWFLLSLISFLVFALPAEAGKITNWRFDRNANRLTFTTDEGVQPQAQLISNPTRLVIDLPGTKLGQPTVNQAIGGTITSLRLGQVEENTARIVIELAPGYTIDPTQIKIQGSSSQSWSVELPTPERINLLPNTLPPSNPSNNQDFSRNIPNGEQKKFFSPFFQVTDNGLFVKIGDSEPKKIDIRRSQENKIDFFLDGITLDPELVKQTLPVGRYGVETIDFFQSNTPNPWARITLTIDPKSPNWQANYSNYGGLVLIPEGGLGAINTNNNREKPIDDSPKSGQTIIQTMEIAGNSNQLLIKTQGNAKVSNSWNRDQGIYEIRIENALIDPNFQGPQLEENSPISVMRIVEEEGDTVVILLQLATGVTIENLNQPSDQLLALQFNRSQIPLPDLTTIPVPSPQNNTFSPPRSTFNPVVPQNDRKNRIVIMVDPGHGGKDPGTIGIGGIQEKNIILPISQHLQEFLTQQGFQVIMTRDSDYFVSLQGRTDMANRANVDLFVSVHANAINLSRPDVNGLETYHFGSGKDLANSIHRNILQRMEIRDRGVRTARFFVLRNTKMPSVLVEVGFLTGREDSVRLQNPDYRRRMAEAIGYGILDYLKNK